jgi:methylenetetrahydrofolate dehydrogenase (NADP+)/methenyltetrahydrofolate cyclohydrolase
MSAIIIDGKAIAEKIMDKLKDEVEGIKVKFGRAPSLAVIRVGDDGASEIYVNNKIKTCEKIGINSVLRQLPKDITEASLIEIVKTLDGDKNINGILVQLPLPKGIDENKVLNHISPSKDVDGFTPLSAGGLMLGNNALAACTPSGVVELIKSTGRPIAGANAVVVGRSNIVGKPAALMLLKENATVTVAHSKTKNIEKITKRADILVVAIGKKEFIKGGHIKKGAIVIDVGINRENGRLYGDIDFKAARARAAYITPVPGGVGPMTIAILMKNTVKAFLNQNG